MGENMSMAVIATEKIWTLLPLIQSMNACMGSCFPGASATSHAFYELHFGVGKFEGGGVVSMLQ